MRHRPLRELESAVRGLLGLQGAAARPGDDPNLSRVRSPKAYFGAMHPTPRDRAQSPRRGEAAYAFGPSPGPRLDQHQLDGTRAREEALVLRSPSGRLCVRFSAAELHLLAGALGTAVLRVRVDDGEQRTLIFY